MTAWPDDRLYFRQLLSGRDFAVGDPVATQMVNFVYAIGDRTTGECVLVDPAYAIDDLVDAVEADGMIVGGVLATHYHQDHVGGSMMGYTIEGVDPPPRAGELPGPRAGRRGAVGRQGHRHRRERAGHPPRRRPGHRRHRRHRAACTRPGHTPGSQCLLVDGLLVSGDTLFLDGCGRTDLPGSDAEQMYDSLQRLAGLPADTIVFPGHRYSMPSSAPMEAITRVQLRLPPPLARTSG